MCTLYCVTFATFSPFRNDIVAEAPEPCTSFARGCALHICSGLTVFAGKANEWRYCGAQALQHPLRGYVGNTRLLTNLAHACAKSSFLVASEPCPFNQREK